MIEAVCSVDTCKAGEPFDFYIFKLVAASGRDGLLQCSAATLNDSGGVRQVNSSMAIFTAPFQRGSTIVIILWGFEQRFLVAEINPWCYVGIGAGNVGRSYFFCDQIVPPSEADFSQDRIGEAVVDKQVMSNFVLLFLLRRPGEDLCRS